MSDLLLRISLVCITIVQPGRGIDPLRDHVVLLRAVRDASLMLRKKAEEGSEGSSQALRSAEGAQLTSFTVRSH